MENKICLVTGATAGVGKATAVGLAERGATVVVHGRNKAKVESVLSEVRERTGKAGHAGLIADFGSLADVRKNCSNKAPLI